MKISFWIILLAFLVFSPLYSQDEAYQEIKNTEVSIPSAPAFALLGVNPEMVLRPADLKSFKVDWRLKNYVLAPDLAIEAQPLWHFHYKNKSFNEYAGISAFEKKLSTLSFSFGTAKIDNINHASVALKMNLFSDNDPLTDATLMSRLQNEYNASVLDIQHQMDSIRVLRRTTEDPARKGELESTLETLEVEKQSQANQMRDKYRSAIEEHYLNNWNRTMLDAAMGLVYTYDNAGTDSLKAKRAGMSFWINGSLRAGKHGMLGGIVKLTRVIDSSNKLIGVSYRYGDSRYNFFVELAFENLGNYFDENLVDAFDEEEYFAPKYIEDLGSGWFNFNNEKTLNQYTIAYGGDFKLSRNILLNFALRTKFTDKLKMDKLVPVANVICLMK
ncbi:MAG: hypothetical protein IPK21_07185 [Haliscomenobacter sp.]|nr:hypothetical protein [Haliscomenobacter sp.]